MVGNIRSITCWEVRRGSGLSRHHNYSNHQTDLIASQLAHHSLNQLPDLLFVGSAGRPGSLLSFVLVLLLVPPHISPENVIFSLF